MRRVTVGLAASVLAVSVAGWFFFYWFAIASGISAAPHAPFAGQVVGAWGQTLMTVVFIAGWALLAVALWQRRSGHRRG